MQTNQYLGTSFFLFPLQVAYFYTAIKKLMICSQLVLDSHRWVPLPAVGFRSNTAEESKEDVTPPSYLMEHPPLAVFINGKSSQCLPLGFFWNYTSYCLLHLCFMPIL
jgi:hypothetical protein